MRILLDGQLSPARVGSRLERLGHDVLCAAADESFRGSTDADLLEVAALTGRVLVTRNARDFVPLTRDWADTGRPHAGVLVVWSRTADEFGSLPDDISEALSAVGGQDAWTGLTRTL